MGSTTEPQKGSEKPDMLISVDFGMTFYPEGSNILSSWGFKSEEKSEQRAEGRDYKEWFKTCLDAERLEKEKSKGPNALFTSMEEVEKLYRDYLRELYQHIERQLGRSIAEKGWADASVEFLFSVPTTWDHRTCKRFEAITRAAGFGKHANHRVVTSLTEAEAAAVFTSTEEPGLFNTHDILLVCDAGGGTTSKTYRNQDLSVLRVINVKDETINLEEIDVVFGDTIGSAAIDQDFESLAFERLSALPHSTLRSSVAAWEMMKSKEFQNVKCEFGAPTDTPLFSVPVPTHDKAYTNEDARVFNGEMQFAQGDLQYMFDKQIRKMDKLIEKQLKNLEQKFPNDQVSELERKYSSSNRSFSNTRNLRFRIAPDPQLAVCKGLVIDRLRRLQSGQGVLNMLCCRASYGTMCRIEYDKKNEEHFNKATFKDERDGKAYLSDAIAWFIKKGEPINIDRPIKHSFSRKVDPANPYRPFLTSIVKSDLDRQDLPIQMGQGTADILCSLEANLTGVDQSQFKEKNKTVWSTRKPYLRVDYEIQVIIEASDIRFELKEDKERTILAQQAVFRKKFLEAIQWMVSQHAHRGLPHH
ncbi:hypothetical protein SLS56_005221 [Neofusicoccum ribis]|uniref:Uncharacterized protein n=1 Tax=Neofusicoccum ribis TaxID=45134 RepID=A0ABR3SU73_9PEZI